MATFHPEFTSEIDRRLRERPITAVHVDPEYAVRGRQYFSVTTHRVGARFVPVDQLRDLPRRSRAGALRDRQGAAAGAAGALGSSAGLDPAELFSIVKPGLKMSGMPPSGSRTMISRSGGVVAFLRRLPGMTPQQYGAYRAEDGSATHTAHGNGHERTRGGGAAHTHRGRGGHSH